MDVFLPASKHTDLVYDVGMHRGEDAEFYLRKGFRVVGVEANPEMVRLCQDRLQSYVKSGQLTIIEGAIVEPFALQKHGGNVAFFVNDRKSHWGTTNPAWVERNQKLGTLSHQIEVVGLDFEAILLQHGIPHYLKIDIEGSDILCLRALRRFRERPDYVSIESEQLGFAHIREEIELLNCLGYDRFQAVEQSEIPTLQIPPQTAKEGSYVDHRFSKGATGLFGAELPGRWLSKGSVLRRYRAIRLGYFFFGVDGALNRLQFFGADLLRSTIRRACSVMTHAIVPGWYDTHARHSTAKGDRHT
jgi:FkbM family methyltransferase